MKNTSLLFRILVLNIVLIISLLLLGLYLFSDKNTNEIYASTLVKNMTDLYVSPDGDDDNTGNIQRPLKTIQAALDIVKPGQTIYLRNGTYSGKNTFMSSGLPDKPISIKRYNKEKAKVTLDKDEEGAIFDINGNSYINIEELDIGSSSAQSVHGVMMTAGAHHINILNNEIHDIKTTHPDDGNKGEANAILLLGEGSDPQSSISHVVISNNYIHDNINGWSENISVAGNCEYVSVNDNLICDNTNIGIDFYGNAGYCPVLDYDQPRNCEALRNRVSNCVSTYADCAGIYVDGGKYILISDNTVYDCPYGIEVGSEEWCSNFKDYEVTKDYNNCQNTCVVQLNHNVLYNNHACSIKIGGYTNDSSTGYVVRVSVCNNKLTHNGNANSSYNCEIALEKCDDVTISANDITHSTNDGQILDYGLGEDYSLNIKMFDNNLNYDNDHKL
ncbi:MAG: DUF1565 domain-containing protein [Oribacterium sp.]|nr:DUF1565 domain-containing protein [Oribacterium sp.]